MNFQQLEYIIGVDTYKHFGQASESCHVTQATLSAMIKKLEEELGVVIFDRSKHPIVTTEQGKKVIKKAKGILLAKKDILDFGKIEIEELEGNLTIGIIPTVANTLLAMILPELIKQHPKLNLSIIEITTDRIKEQLFSENIDLGILATPLEDESLEENILYYEPMMVYGIKERHKKYVTPEEVYGKKVWMLEEGNCFRAQSSTICKVKESSSKPFNLDFEASSFDTLINLTDSFGGYTLIPELYYKRLPKDKQGITRSFEVPIPVREISVVYYRPFAKKQSIELLSKFIKQLVAPQLSTYKRKPKDMNIIGI